MRLSYINLPLLLLLPLHAQGQNMDTSTYYQEHLRWGKPSADTVFVRKAYVMAFDTAHRIPHWVAFRVVPDYRKTPKRKGKFSSFRADPAIPHSALDYEYKGLYDSLEYARGHFCPYAVLGGDRDGDGSYATWDEASDPYDEETIFQGNLMSNIAPQHQLTINGPGSLWFALERFVQDELVVKQNREVFVYAGQVIFDTRNLEKVGPKKDIAVPDLFYQVLVIPQENKPLPEVKAYLFPHYRFKEDMKSRAIEDYRVPVRYLEAITGLDFFTVFPKKEQELLER